VENLESCRWLFNHMLQRKGEGWKWSQIQGEIPSLVKEHPFLCEVHSKTRQYVMWQLKANIKALGQLKKQGRRVGNIRFRGKGRFKTFVYNQSGFEVRGKKLWLSKIGEIPLKQHRDIIGVVKQVVVKRTPTNKWFAVFCCDVDFKSYQPKTAVVGIDLGVEHFAVDSDGNYAENPLYLKKALKKLNREQRRLSRKQKGSTNRFKQKFKVARVHEKVEDARHDFLHKLSTYYVRNYGVIAVEDLSVKELAEKQYNSRNILDSSWSTFVGMLDYKAESAGVQLLKVDPKNTTQNCSVCGSYVYKPLWIREHKCPQCGIQLDRDYNASRNIIQKALSELGQELSESTLAEIQPLSESIWFGQAESMSQEAPSERVE